MKSTCKMVAEKESLEIKEKQTKQNQRTEAKEERNSKWGCAVSRPDVLCGPCSALGPGDSSPCVFRGNTESEEQAECPRAQAHMPIPQSLAPG